MKQETVKAASISTGDEIEIDLGRGKTFRPVDKVADGPNNSLVFTLYSSSGVRPKVTVNKDALIVRRLP